MNPLEQQQHRLPQVYLKQFGYIKNGKWWVSIYQIGKTFSDNILIESFTTGINIFDLPFNDYKIKRHFENTSGVIENRYNTVISNLHNQKQLTPKDRDLLCHLVPNILCRTHWFRNFVDSLLRTHDTRQKFLDEITLFSNNSEDKELTKLLELIKIDFQLNFVIGILMNHMVTIFRKFNYVILKSPDNYNWLTSDNPVYMNKQNNLAWIIPLEAEIYFPLSQDFCLFMFHDSSEIQTNKLRKLKSNKINKIDFESFDEITKKVTTNLKDYLIMVGEVESTDISKELPL